MNYNTQREYLLIREYGRNIHNMVNALKTIAIDNRLHNAQSIIKILEVLNPDLKQYDNVQQILWDHLFLIADDNIDIPNAPYPKPPKNFLQKKEILQPLPYPKTHPKFSHMGKNFERLLECTLQETDIEKRNYLTNILAYYMKIAYFNWHKEVVHDDSIKSELLQLAKGQLEYPNNMPSFRFKPNSIPNSYSFSNSSKRHGNNLKHKGKRKY
ncbi:MAG: DUF4290 domain-containing protein [Chitinophagaceae bacterium]